MKTIRELISNVLSYAALIHPPQREGQESWKDLNGETQGVYRRLETYVPPKPHVL